MSKRRLAIFLCLLAAMVTLDWGFERVRAQSSGPNIPGTPNDSLTPTPGQMRGLTPKMRKAAAQRLAAQRAAVAKRTKAKGPAAAGPEAALYAAPAAAPAAPPPIPVLNPTAPPDYFGQANWANSPLPVIDPATLNVTGGIHKFVDTLPGLGAANHNNNGQYIPIAVPDTITYPGSDYYEINLIDFFEKMHTDLPPTKIRGYVQVNNGTNSATLQNTVAPAPAHYLGPLILCRTDRPVRVKFNNKLTTGSGGNLFIPVDTSVMGAGMGPLDMPGMPGMKESYTQNRTTLHLHGGVTPWISDGTPHQWTTPAGENTQYPKGVSVRYVPDMYFDPVTHNTVSSATVGATNDPGPGSLTFYYTNQQSARLMFYHDHSYGITRLNVYAGEAAGYLVTDPVEDNLITTGALPNQGGGVYQYGIPLIIQDKTFVPDVSPGGQMARTDPTWDVAKWGGFGQLWFPHVYIPNQNPGDESGANPYGRWDYGPWFWPPITPDLLKFPPVPNPYYDPINAPWENKESPGFPTPSMVMEAFLDTPVINGTAYPTVTLQPQAYRFRILNACNDRMLNLQLYQAQPGGGATATATVNLTSGSLASINVTNGGSGYTVAPNVYIAGGGGINAAAAATVTGGVVTAVNIISGGSGFTSPPLITFGGNTEVRMVPAAPDTGLPTRWPTDGRDGGVPDPLLAGPSMIQIGTEGGFLPSPVVIPPTPIGYVYNRRDIVVLNVSTHALLIGPAERADIIVDFSPYAGKTLILYNDAPAPIPAFDTRLDYYTGGPDQTDSGGAPTTLPGYGPNTRTMMQIKVAAATPVPFNAAPLNTALPKAFNASQSPILVPQKAYNPLYNNTIVTNTYSRIQSTSLNFQSPMKGLGSIVVTAGGSGYTTPPDVSITGGGGTGAQAVSRVSVGVTTVTIDNGGSGYVNPTVVFTGGGSTGAAATAVVTGGVITGVIVTNPGSGYLSAPQVGFTDAAGTGALATAHLSGVVSSVVLTNAGTGYTTSPLVAFSGGGGANAAAVANLKVTVPLLPKAIQELFELDYGRMNATLGVELPFTNFNTQTTIPYGYVDPPTEYLQSGVPQYWKITHNGVDTHAIHFHLFNVQLVNRVGWDGAIRPPDANELGWKETIRMNPLEDAIVAIQPVAPRLPWPLPDSIRPLDPTMPLGTTGQFTNIDPQTGRAITVINQMFNFGWEYVWHCHILGHEEMDMMRAMVVQVVQVITAALPNATVGAPYNQSLSAAGGLAPYTWAISAGALPPGLVLDPNNGTINGTPTTVGTFTFTVAFVDTNAAGNSRQLSIQVMAAPTVATTTLPNGEINLAYNQTLAVAGGVTPYTWAVTAGALPGGLNLTAATGAISGNPTTTGTFNFTVRVTDVNGASGTGNLSITIIAGPTINTTALPSGEVGVAYNQTMSATGGLAPYTWSILAGALPGGLTLTPATGGIAGTPTTGGLFIFTAEVTDANGIIGTAALSINVIPPPTITTLALPAATVGGPYNQSLAVTGGTLPYTWSLTVGTLPSGMGLSTAGVISGTPTVAGTFPITVQVSDGLNVTASANLSLVVLVAPVITTTALPNGEVNLAYSQTLAASGGMLPYTWSISSGALPGGLNLNSATGVISGTPTAAGTFNFTARVADANGGPATANLSITVIALPSITTTALPNGEVGAPYNQTLAATGGLSPYTWTVSAGALPGGLTFNGATGVISGTPLAGGTFNFTVQVQDSNNLTGSRALSIIIVTGPSITTIALPNATVNGLYNQTLAATGGVTPYTWSAGQLPAGLGLSTAGVLSGTPTTAGVYPILVQVTDINNVTVSKYLNLTISMAPIILTTVLPVGEVGVVYNQTLSAIGGILPYTWSVTAGALPGGLSLNSATGAIAGTPTASGTFTFTAQVLESNGVTATQGLSITIAPVPAIVTTSLPGGEIGVLYNQTVTATGGISSYTWSIPAGALPGGLNLNAATGVISGNPTTSGTFNFTVQATDVNGMFGTANLSISIVTGPNVTTTALPNGEVNVAYNQTLSATAGTGPYTWSILGGALPGGLGLTPATGAIAGTPTTAGTFAFTAAVTDANGIIGTAALSITVIPPPTITTLALPAATAGGPYTQSLAATGGTLPYTWTLTGGALPAGLGLSAAGVISGTPTAAGTFPITVQVSDGLNVTASANLSLIVIVAPVITTAALPNGEVNLVYSQTLAASGGAWPYLWAISSGALPGGLTLNSGTGVISGTPTAAGTFNFTAWCADANGSPATANLSITVLALPTITTTALPSGEIGAPYSQTLAVTGGWSPYTWTVSAGTLPGGLTLDGATGVISGTPLAAGTFNFTVQVQDSNNLTGSMALSIIIVAGPSITTTALPNGTVNGLYNQTLAATGGITPYSWSAGALPSGLSLTTAGVLNGRPTSGGTYLILVQVTDSNGVTASKSLSLTISMAPIILTTVLPGGEIGLAYNQTLSAIGGVLPYTWSIAAGALPGGLTLNSATGAISGTPTAAGTFSFTAQVRESNGVMDNQGLSITIAAAPAILTTSLPGGEVSVVYSQSLTASGGVSSYTWSISAGALPGGLTLNATTGIIGGMPTAAGTFTFTVQVRDVNNISATKSLSIAVVPKPTITTTTPMPGGWVGLAYSRTLVATGGVTPYTWAILGGTLPGGLLLNATTGNISGTPTTAGVFTFTVQVMDGRNVSATKSLSITIQAGPSITNTALPNGEVAASYLQTMTATGGVSPYTWLITAGALPPGLSLNGGTGNIAGKPMATGTYTFTVRVRDAQGLTATKSLSILVIAGPTVTTTALPRAERGLAYTQTLTATGGITPYAWTIAIGALPPGLSLNGATGNITGTPTATGTFSFTVRVTDAAKVTATKGLTIYVIAPVTISTTSLPAGRLATAYAQTLTATGGISPYVWTVASGALPGGLTLNGTTGAIRGTPTARGTFNFTIRCSDSLNYAVTRAFSIVIN